MSNNPLRSTGGLSRIAGDRVVLRHAPDRRAIRDQIDRNRESECAVSACGLQRWGLSAMCRHHYRHWEGTGHPTVPSVRRTSWLPWVADSYAFVCDQLLHDHPGIAAGVSWCAEELFGGRV